MLKSHYQGVSYVFDIKILVLLDYHQVKRFNKLSLGHLHFNAHRNYYLCFVLDSEISKNYHSRIDMFYLMFHK